MARAVAATRPAPAGLTAQAIPALFPIPGPAYM